MNFETIRVRMQKAVCFIELHRPEHRNAINARMIEEFHQALDLHSERASVLVVQGNSEVFCMGADFNEIATGARSPGDVDRNPESVFCLWERLVHGPFISIAHVRGKANAGGLGFVAAADIVLSDWSSVFSLSELLFDLLPACVLPFLVRRIGFPRARCLALSTRSIVAQQALDWGLVDACDEDSERLLRVFLSRLTKVPGSSVQRCKRYLNELEGGTSWAKEPALAAHREAFSDPRSLSNIARYMQSGLFPWEE